MTMHPTPSFFWSGCFRSRLHRNKKATPASMNPQPAIGWMNINMHMETEACTFCKRPQGFRDFRILDFGFEEPEKGEVIYD